MISKAFKFNSLVVPFSEGCTNDQRDSGKLQGDPSVTVACKSAEEALGGPWALGEGPIRNNVNPG